MSSHIHRLLSIVETLSTCADGIEITEIANVRQVSDKTIRRDLNCLRKMGCRLDETISGKGKKHVGRNKALRRSGNGPLETEYIQRTVPKFHRSRVGGDYTQHGAMIDDLQLAIEDQLVLKVAYLSADRQSALSYEIHPYGMVEHRATLYIVGYSSHRRAIRTWKLERFRSVELTRTKFDRPEGFDLRDHFQDAFAVIAGQRLQVVKVRFEASVARYVAEKKMHASQRLDELPDGSVLVQFELSSLLEIKSWILSFGSRAEVLEPAELRTAIAREVERMTATYRVKTDRRTRHARPK